MCKYFLSVVCFLVFSINAFSTDFILPQRAIIGGDVPIRKGEMVLLSVSPLTDVPHLKNVSYSWKVLDTNYKEKQNVVIWPDGTKVFFGAGLENKKLLVLLVMTYHYEVKDASGKISESAVRSSGILLSEVLIGDDPNPTPPGPSPVPPGPQPTPPNPPTPVPTPVVPDTKFGLAKYAFNTVNEKVQLNSVEKAKVARVFASCFDGVAAAASAGTIKDIKEFLTKTREAMESAIAREGINKQTIQAADDAIGQKLYELYKDRKLVSLQDFIEAFRELSTGLSYIK